MYEGPKQDEVMVYQRINWIREFISGIETSDVESYSLSLGRYYKWMLMAMDMRKSDVRKRALQKIKERQEREDAILKEEERKKDRTTFVEEEKVKFDEEQAQKR